MTGARAQGVERYWVDGVEGAAVAADDRGFAYGDGLFETLAVIDGRPRLLDYHLDRLQDGCRRLGLPLQRAALAQRLGGYAAELGDGVLKLVLTRGSGPRGYRLPASVQPREAIYASPRPAGFAALGGPPLRVRICRTPISVNAALAGLKHLNRLDQVLACAEWDDAATDEGLMLDDAGRIVCATAANVFLAEGEALVTPALARAGVAGVMRRAVLAAARRLGVPCEVGDVDPARLRAATEVMLSSALIGLRPVASVDGRPLPSHGPLTQRLQQALQETL